MRHGVHHFAFSKPTDDPIDSSWGNPSAGFVKTMEGNALRKSQTIFRWEFPRLEGQKASGKPVR